MADDRWQTFAPIPARAVADVALTAEQFRVLSAIAFHDRFNANGKGCCASHPRLAGLAKCHLKSLSRSLKALAEGGYIETLPSPYKKSQRAYTVVYTDADKALMSIPIGNNAATYSDGIGNNPVPESPDIGNKDFYEPEQYQELPDDKIFCETVRYPVETEKNNSAQAASPDGDEDLLGNEEAETHRQISEGEYLAKVQRWLKQHSPHLLNADEIAAITAARDECRRLEDEHGTGFQGGVGGWAQRLSDELDIVIENGTEPDAFNPEAWS